MTKEEKHYWFAAKCDALLLVLSITNLDVCTRCLSSQHKKPAIFAVIKIPIYTPVGLHYFHQDPIMK